MRLGHAYRPENPEPRVCMVEVYQLIVGERKLEARPPERPEVLECEELLGADPRPVYAFVGDLHPKLGRVGLVVAREWSSAAFQGATLCDSGGLFMCIGGFEAAGEQARKHLCELSSPSACTKETWEADFAQEVAECYKNGARGYVYGDEPTGLPSPRGEYIEFARSNNVTDRRLWTWELRMSEGPGHQNYVAVALTDIDSKHFEALESERGGALDAATVIVGDVTPNGHPFLLPRLRELLLGEVS